MRKSTLSSVVVLLIILNIGLLENVENVMSSSHQNWTWSNELQTGDVYQWNVDKFSINGSMIDFPSFGTGWLAVGSTIKIEILKPPSNFNWLQVEQGDFQLYFKSTIDGSFRNILNIILFIYPIIFDFGNGTTINVFEEATSSNNSIFYDAIGQKNLIIEDNLLIQTETLDDYSFDLESNVNTGVLQKYHTISSDLYELELSLSNFHLSSNQQNTFWVKQRFWILTLASGIILLGILYVKKFKKS